MTRRLTLALLGLLATCTGLAAANPPLDPSRLPLPGATLIPVGGRQLATRCDGTSRPGVPTIILISGQGVPAATWVAPPPEELQAEVLLRPPFSPRRPVMESLAALTLTCAYDRPGLGSSPELPDATPRTVADAVADLHALTGHLSPDRPVLLVGHSMGGLIAFEYARRYPQQTAGLVLLDATHPDERQRLQWLFPADAGQEAWVISHGPEHLDSRPATTQGPEAARPGLLGTLPLAVLTRTNSFDLPPAGAGAGGAQAARWRRDHWTLAAEYASTSTRGVLISANDSGHFIAFDQPDLVVTAVRDVLTAAVKADQR